MPASMQPVPAVAANFFASLSAEGYPPASTKTQPWKKLWNEPQAPVQKDGKMVVACTSSHDYGNTVEISFFKHTLKTR
jgi:hypothetical protein